GHARCGPRRRLSGHACSVVDCDPDGAPTYFSGQTTPASMLDSYRTARHAGLLWLLLIADCLVAPVTEEFAMRGFLFRGWSKSFLGPVGAILLTSAIWTLLHTQYSWF